jgi:hypothetical protein
MMKFVGYLSPQGETSLFKNIPMTEYTEETRNYFRSLMKPGVELRFLFRGPRPAKLGRSSYTRQSYCIKEDAKTFAVYVRR